MHATGAMKSFLDHYGYRYMVHRPEEKMFSKQAVCISTAAGMRSTIKDMADSTFFWGCVRTYKLGVAVMETRWEMVKPKIKSKIDKKTDLLAKQLLSRADKIKPTIKTRVFFGIMSLVQKMVLMKQMLITGRQRDGQTERNLGKNDGESRVFSCEMISY